MLRGAVVAVLLLLATRPGGGSGSDPYTPTKLEWFAVLLNASHHEPWTNFGDIGITFFPRFPNTILIKADYDKPAMADLAKSRVRQNRQLVETLAAARGWTWLLVEEQANQLNVP